METQSRQDVQERLKSIQRLLKETCAQFEKITKRRLESRRFEDVKSFEDLMNKISSGEKGDDDESRETRQKFLTIVSTIQTLTGPVKSATDIVSVPYLGKSKKDKRKAIKISAWGGMFISACFMKLRFTF